jgi:PAS domain S-box-containing protein
VAQACAGLAFLVGSLTLSSYMFHADFGIDQWLFWDPTSTFHPGRMAPLSAFNFILLGLTLLLIDVETHRGYRPSEFLSFLIILTALYGLLDVTFLPQTTYVKMAVHTSVAFVVCAVGLLCSRPDRGTMARVTSESSGAILLRRVLPTALIIPLVLSWLQWLNERLDLFDWEVVLAGMVFVAIAVFVVLVAWAARSIDGVETERNQMQAALQEREQMLHGLFEYAPDALVVVNGDGHIVRFNAQAEKIFGYRREELLGEPMEILLPERSRMLHMAHRRNYMRNPRNRPMGVGLELYGRHKNGSEFPVDIMLSPVQTATDGLAIATVRDITERKHAEEALQHRTAELTRSNIDLEQFAYVASHDLQEPLRAISGCVQILQRRYGDALDARAKELITHTVEGATRMQTKIHELLTYSRVSRRGKAFEPTSCEKVLDQVLTTLQPLIKKSGAVVTHMSLPIVMGDAGQLGQLFQHLLRNAMMFHRETPPAIHIGVDCHEKEWVFAVQDNGIGIAPEYFERIFVIFQRLHTRTEYAGTGMGLAICKKIVERHGGRIWVTSAPGEGSTFYFSLPTGGDLRHDPKPVKSTS